MYIYIICASLFCKRVHFLDHILLWRSKQICISRPKINERAVHVYIYNLTVNLSIFCNNFVRFLEDAALHAMNSIFSDIVVMSALVASKSI